MRFQRNALATLLGSLVLVVGVTAFQTSRLFIENTEKIENSQYDLMKRIVEFNLRGLETRALARAELVASLPRVKELLATGNREGMLAELKPMFEIQRDKFGVDQAQFHLPPATSFLRLNNPAKFGDDLTSYRPIVTAVNTDFVSRKGLSISRSGPGIFGVAPVTDPAGKPIGSFEFGGNFGPIMDGIKAAYGLESALFIDEEKLKGAAPELGGDVYSEKNRMGRFVKYQSTNWELLRNLVGDSDLAGDREPYARDVQDTPYGVIVVPLRNPAGDTLGFIVAAKDFSTSRGVLGQSMIWLVMYSLFGLVLMMGVILVIMRGAVARPLAVLNQRFQGLVDGEPALPLDNTAGYYGEIHTLAEHYENLRQRRQTAAGAP